MNMASLLVRKASNAYIGAGLYTLNGDVEKRFVKRYSFPTTELFMKRMQWYALLKKLSYIGAPEI